MSQVNQPQKNTLSRTLNSLKNLMTGETKAQQQVIEQSHQASVRFESMEPRMLLAGDAAGVVAVTGSIDIQGEQDRYEFTLDSTHRVVFDSLTNRQDITWRLENEQGVVIDNLALPQTESNKPLAELAAGHYRLTVDGVGDARGDYQLRLIDVNGAQDLVMGQAISGELATGKETQVYRVNAQAGDSFYLQSLLSTSQVSWRLIDPDNQVAVSYTSFYSDKDSTLLQKSGQYLLLVEGNINNTTAADYSFIWHKVEHQQQSLSLDQLTTANINTIGQKAIFNFSITEPTQVLLNALSQTPFTWQLTGSQGTVVSERTYQAQSQMAYPYALLSLLAGDYQLTIDLAETATASIPFSLLTTHAASVLTTQQVYQQYLNAAQSQLLKINLEQGEKLRLDASVGLTWQLIDRFGLAVTPSANSSQVVEVTDSGTYYLRLHATQSNDYQLSLTPIADMVHSINANGVIAGQSNHIEQISHYDFTLSQASSLSLSIEQGLTGFMYRLVGPRGEEKAWQTLNNLNMAYLPTGQYRLSVKSTQQTGSYALQLNTSAIMPQPVPETGEALILNQTIAAVLPETGEAKQVYRFSLSEDSLLWMDVLASSGVSWSLVGPKGVEVEQRSFSNTDAPYAISGLSLLAGDYALTLTGQAAEAYSFRLLNAADTPSLTINQATLVDISPVSSNVIYQFEAQAEQQFVLARSYDYGQYWSVYDAYGQKVTLDYHSVGYRFTTSHAGQYYLSIEGAYYQTGSSQAQFTLYQPHISSVALTLNDRLSASLEHRFDQVNYQFSVDKPEVFVLDSLVNSNSASVEWQLTSSQGHVFDWRTLTASQGARLLQAGRYTLSLRNTAEQAASYQVAVLNRQAATPLAFAQAQQADLSQGQQVLYRFSAQAGDSLYLQGDWNNTWNSRWTLFNAYGQQVLQDYTRGDKPQVQLTTTGEYLLVLSSSSSQDQVNFTAWPRTVTSQPLSFNTPISASLSEPAQRYRYSFSIDSEKTLYIAPNSHAQTQYWQWRLLDSQGQTIRQQDFKNGEFHLLAAGSYSIELSANDLSTGDFSFQVFDSSQLPSLNINQVQQISLNAQQQQQVYRVNIASNSKFLIKGDDLPANSVWKLFNARGQQLIFGSAGDVSEGLSLLAGDYFLVVGDQSVVDTTTGQVSIHTLTTVAQPAQLDTDLSGTISQLGQQQAYVFEISQATMVLLDYLNQGSDFVWQLSGPNGVLYDGVGLSDFELRPFVLQAGQHTLTVSSRSAAVGDFKFKLRNFSTTPLLPLGQQSLNFLAEQSQLWAVNVQAGQTFSWQMSNPPSTAFSLRIFNASGQRIGEDSMRLDDTNLEQRIQFAQAGQYFIQFTPEEHQSLSGELAVDVNIQLLSQQSQTASLEQVMVGQSRATNFAESWIFSLNQPTRLLFDGLSGVDHEIRLYRHNGQVQYQGLLQDSALWQLAAGAYRLEVIANDPQVLGDYQFKLTDIVAAPLLILDQTVTVNPMGEQAQIYRVHSLTDQLLALQLQASEQASGTVSVFDASGHLLAQGNLADYQGTLSTQLGSDYVEKVIVIEGLTEDTTLTAQTTAIISENLPVFNLGQTHADNLAQEGDIIRYHLKVAQGQSLSLSALVHVNPAGALAWQVAYWGASVDEEAWSDQMSYSDWMLSEGDYVFSVIARQDNINYQIQILDTQAPLLLNESVVATLPAHFAHLYAVDLSEEQVLNLHWQSNDTTLLAYQLYDQNGQVLSQSEQADDITTELLAAGRYWILVKNLSTELVDYELAIQPIVSYSPVSTALVFNQQIQGGVNYQQPTEQSYVFNLTQPTTLVLDIQQVFGEYWGDDGYSNGEMSWQIKRHGVDIDAAYVSQASDNNGYQLLNLAVGEYELYLSAAENHHYQLRVSTLQEMAVPIVIDQTVQQTAEAGQLNVYRFEATANQALRLNFETVHGESTWRLLDEYGRYLEEGDSSVSPFLPTTGIYYLLIDNQGITAGEQVDSTFTLSNIIQEALPLDLNTLTVNDFDAQGQLRYQVTVDAAKVLWLDADLDPDFGMGFDFEVRDAFGVLLAQQGQMLVLPNAGTYTLTLSNTTGNNSRQAQFIIADISQPISVNVGDTLSGTLTQAQGLVAYQLTLSNPSQVNLVNLLSENTDYAHRWYLIDTYGRMIDSGRLTDPETLLDLAVGSYRLLIDHQQSSDDLSYQLQFIVQVPIVPTPLALNQVLSVNIPAQSEQHYTFHVDQGRVFIFDGLNDIPSSNWVLRHAQGQTVFYHSFNRDADSVQYLAAGDYELVLSNEGGQPAVFQLQVLDSKQASVLAQGQQPLNPDSTQQYKVYHLDMLAGERYFFDVLPFSYLTTDYWGDKPNLSWRLVDEAGDWVFSGQIGDYQNRSSQYSYQNNQWQYLFDFVGNDQELVLQKTGRYTLIIESNGVSNPPEFMLDFVQVPLQAVIPLEGFIEQAKPDLSLSPLVLTPNAAQTGDVVQVQWTVTNNGNAPVNQLWHDRIVVKNTDTGEVLLSLTVPYDGQQQPLAQGQSIQRSQLLQLPANASAAGSVSVSVVVDADNYINEYQTGVDAEQNNRQSSILEVGLASYPDLMAEQLTISPSSNLQPNQTVILSWQTLNQGQATAQGAWQERVEIRHLSSGQLIDVLLVNTDNTHLAVGERISRQLSFTWPSGALASGEFEIRVIVDHLQQVAEANDTQTAEDNNQSSFRFWSGADLIVQDLQLNNSQLQAGDLVSVTWQVQNQGNSTIDTPFYEHIRVYQTSTGRVLLDTSLIYDALAQGAIAAGQVKARQFSFYLPEGLLGTGEFTVEVTTDQNSAGLGQIYEVNAEGNAEANNQQSLVVSAAAKAYADLVISDWTSPSVAIAGQALDLSWWVKNQGQIASQGRRQDVVVLSRDAQFGNADDVVLANVYDEQVLAIDEQRQQHSRITLPQLNAGRYYLAIRTNVDGAVLEPDTQANNLSVVHAIDISQAYTDLVVSNIQLPEQAQSGETIAVTWTVTNVGNQSTDLALWSDRVVLSNDAVLSSDDIILAGNVTHLGQLAPNQYYTGRATLTLPRDVSGNFYVIVKTNQQGTVTETDHSDNNTLSQTIQIALSPVADLTVSALQAPSVLRPNQAANLSYRVTNQGNAATNTVWRDRLYLEDNQGNCIELASTMRTQGLAIGESRDDSFNFILPSHLAEGDYHWLVVTDSDNTVYEREQENNNSVRAAVSVRKVDLHVTALQAPSLLVSGQVLTIGWTVHNRGAAIDGTWVDTVYLSQNGQTTRLGEVTYTGSLATDASYQQQLNYTLPLSSSGEYEIIIVTDSKNVLDDSSRLNNRSSQALNVDLATYADLVVTDVQAPTQLIADPALLTVAWTVTNQGTGAGQQSTWTDRLILSQDSVLGNGDDRIVGEFIHQGALTADASYQRQESVYLPPLLSGRFKLFVVTDAKAQVFENQLESNNAMVRDLDVMTQPYADLQVESLSVQGQADSGKPLVVTWRVANHGIGISDQTMWRDNLWLSTNPDGTGQQISLANSTHLGALAANDAYSNQLAVMIPEGLEGPYYLNLKTGAGVYEFIYDKNNTHHLSLPITLSPSADLIVETIQLPSTAQEGGLIDVTWTVLNQGSVATQGQWQDSVYLVPLTANAATTPVLLGSYTYSQSLASGIRYSRTEQLRLPSKIEGLYRLQVVTNAVTVANRVYEQGLARDNNSTVSTDSMTVTLNDRPDLRLTSVEIPNEAIAGGSAAIRYTVANLGAGAATGRWQDKVYLSLDGTLSADDLLVGSFDNNSALAPTES